MTELVITLDNEAQIGLLLADLKRLAAMRGFDLSVAQNGQRIALDAVPDEDARFEATVDQIIEDKLAGRLAPLTPEEEEAEERELATYGEQKAQESGVISDDEIVQIVNEYRIDKAALDDDARFEAEVQQIIADKLAGKLEPLTEEEERADDEYWETIGAELNLTDDDIVRIVKQVRAESHAKTAT